VFLSGGIGVTPVRSIVLQAAHDKLPHRITLLYSNRTPEDAAFLDDFARAQDENPNFTFVPTMTQMDHSSQSWSGEAGLIDAAMLTRTVGDLKLPIFYISGPRQMVAAMRETLNKSGVDDDKIRTEEFSGY
jgi:ferredoxin-NADP reductase